MIESSRFYQKRMHDAKGILIPLFVTSKSS